MRWDVWNQVEQILIHHRITPVLAVIPDNRDQTLRFQPEPDDFWARVRSWQERGWTIGLHGYQHLYVTRSSGLVGIKNNSEFAGLPRNEQQNKLESATTIFRKHGVKPDLFIAPGHSFDRTTLVVLKQLGVEFISDGLFLYPHTDQGGVTWIPQQLWQFRSFPIGVWTICYHHNSWTDSTINRFEKDIVRFRSKISCFEHIVQASKTHPRKKPSVVIPLIFRTALKLKKNVQRKNRRTPS
jgi:predicted deacetylase